jgi:hypothetical protein
MAKRKPYSKPEITRVDLDQSITLMMASPPGNPMMMPMAGGEKGVDTPFTNPFDNKPFS